MLQAVWAERTWGTRESQWRKFVLFCEEDDRVAFPADEGTVLAYLGYLRMEGRVSGTSVAQYISAVARHHELGGVPSPTATPLVKALLKAYAKEVGPTVPDAVRVALPAGVVQQIAELGLRTPSVSLVRDTTLCVIAFISASRPSTVCAMTPADCDLSPSGVLTLRLVHRKGRNARDPLVQSYPLNEGVGGGVTPQALFARWADRRPASSSLWGLRPGETVPSQMLQESLQTVLHALSVRAPPGCVYSAHSLRIGAYNEMRVLGIPMPRVMHHLGWSSPAMQTTYYDPRIVVTDASTWAFGHLRGT